MFIPTATPNRPRSRLHCAIFGLSLCAILSFTIILDDDFPLLSLPRRRRLAYLDAHPVKPFPYGRDLVDPNYQSLVQPSDIDGSLFRKQAKRAGGGGDAGDADAAAACDDVLLFLPFSFAHNGHGSQLNNYLLAAMVATFADRAMVVLEPPRALNVFKSNSQFGCPPEAWETKVLRAGGEPKRVGWNGDFPSGLSRLVKHPAWLSRQCPVPCEYAYEEWDERRLANNATEAPLPLEINCPTKTANGEERSSNVIVMGGQQIRDYFWSHYKDRMLGRPPALAEAWAARLGARPHEARVFAGLSDRYQVWDYASALMVRSGVLRFQPWIARDVEGHVSKTGLPLDVPYDAVHVRRGDKLKSDARAFVRKYWEGKYDEETQDMPRDYVPFVHYLSRFDAGDGDRLVSGRSEGDCAEDPPARLVYVATDDPAEVRREVEDLPKDSEGNTLFADEGGCQIKFRLVFGSPPEEEEEEEGGEATPEFHLDSGRSKGDCEERYSRNIASIADLMILSKADVFVGEFNSNWGRLVRTFRLRLNDSGKVKNGARPVLTRGETRIAWGHKRPGPPGW